MDAGRAAAIALNANGMYFNEPERSSIFPLKKFKP